jgi:hypothetical protein
MDGVPLARFCEAHGQLGGRHTYWAKEIEGRHAISGRASANTNT